MLDVLARAHEVALTTCETITTNPWGHPPQAKSNQQTAQKAHDYIENCQATQWEAKKIDGNNRRKTC
jgi:hypothetical protein